MATKAVFISAFYEQMTSFLSELAEMYPQDKDFPMFITGLKWYRTMNPAKPIRDVFVNTDLFIDKILAKDERFFLDYKFDEYAEHIDNNIFIKLKEHFASMSESSKESVWQYTSNITRLAKKCSE